MNNSELEHFDSKCSNVLGIENFIKKEKLGNCK